MTLLFVPVDKYVIDRRVCMEFFSWRTNSWMNRLHVALNSKQEVELKVELLTGAWEEEKKKKHPSVLL